MVPQISICIVTGRRDAVLDACLQSLSAQQDAPPHELLVCAEGDPAVAEVVHRRFPGAQVAFVDRAFPGAARNVLVERARGELLLFLDDDITVDEDLLARLARLADEHPDTGVFGGPNDTPHASTSFQFVQGAALASIVGSGPVRRRYGAHPEGVADERYFTLCNLAVRREVMVPFATDLVCAEENDVLEELRRRKVSMLYSPELVAYHERRATPMGFARQMFKYGRGRGQLSVRRPRDLRFPFLVPTLLLAYLVAAPLLTLAFGPVALIGVAAYLLAALAGAARIAYTLRRPSEIVLAFWLLVVMHCCYGAGFVRGVASRRTPVAPAQARLWDGPDVAQILGRAGVPGVPSVITHADNLTAVDKLGE
ncbi:MAG TPA: glycosyltransferase [Acidimicrobiales bacterium]|nr:glycosyltransferase [Acidimicrobiales bacterium]